MSIIGSLVRWKEEDGQVAEGTVESAEVKHNANLDMDLTHVVIRWHDGQEATQHTWESLVKDERVEVVVNTSERMTKTTHTPNWMPERVMPNSKLIHPKPTHYVTCAPKEPGNRVVAAVFSVDGESAENLARLIAAAPEVLEALEYAYKCAGEEWMRTGRCTKAEPMSALMARLAPAIAKARGMGPQAPAPASKPAAPAKPRGLTDKIRLHEETLEEASLADAAPDLMQCCEAVLSRLDLEAAQRPAAIFPCSAMRESLRAAIGSAKGAPPASTPQTTTVPPKAPPAKIDANFLACCLVRANEAALAADPGEAEDRGTCCMDSPTIKLKGVRQTVIDEAVRLSGVEVGSQMSGWWAGYRFVRTAQQGQARRREMMSEAAYKSLLADGLDARHYQQMD